MHSAKSLVIFLLLVYFMVCKLAQAEEGLTLYYDFEEETASDKSGNGYDGTLTGAPGLIEGIVGNAWEFNGATKIDMGQAIFMAAHPELSVCCFIQPDNVEDKHTIYDEGGGSQGFCVQITNGELQFGVFSAGGPEVIVCSSELPDTEDWMYIAAVFDNGTMVLYINGEKVDEEKTNWTQVSAHGQAASIGWGAGTAFGASTGGFFSGNIDEFRVYSRTLTPEEIKKNYRAVTNISIESAGKPTTWGSIKAWD